MLRKLLALAFFALFATDALAANRLDVSEYSNVPRVNGYLIQVAPEPGIDQTPVDFSGGVATSAAFKATTTFIWIMCDTQCSWVIGANPVATTSNKRLPALVPLYVNVQPGQKISVIASP